MTSRQLPLPKLCPTHPTPHPPITPQHVLQTEILTVTTSATGWFPLQLDYFEWDSGAALTLEWEGPNTGGRGVIPSSHLSPVGGAA